MWPGRQSQPQGGVEATDPVPASNTIEAGFAMAGQARVGVVPVEAEEVP
jgi:hypothetical protein